MARRQFRAGPQLQTQANLFDIFPVRHDHGCGILHVIDNRVSRQGPLAGRQLNAPSVLPAQTNALLLSNTVVQIAVDSAGQVISARLLDRSGSVDADGYALVQARNLRFRPSPGPVPVWGNAVIEWQTLAPSNVTAAITSFTQ